jgi:type I restriction enzyme M protein
VTNEKSEIDQHVRRLIEQIDPSSHIWEQGAGSPELVAALKGGSKSADPRNPGKPEFAFFSNNFLVVVEDKKDSSKLASLDDLGEVDLTVPARANFAVNGAVHYARHIVRSTSWSSGVFAIGATGDSVHFESQCYWVTVDGLKRLPDLENFDDLAPERIVEFHRVAVLGELPKHEADLRSVKRIAEALHEDMRNYGSLEGERKATTVSAILLALKNPDFTLDLLRGERRGRSTDGWKVYNHATSYLESAYVDDQTGNQKRGTIMDQFTFIRDSVVLNSPRKELGGKTPLRKFAETLSAEVIGHITPASSFDILGNFYGEFVKYGGSDGNALGIVLTPHHVTTLMAELINVGPDDYVLDPCAGTAAFLIAAMNRMVQLAKGDEQVIDSIRSDRLHGVELQDKLYAIGATNMILRGDGKSHFLRNDIFHIDDAELRSYRIAGSGDRAIPVGFTRCLMNPPFSQSKSSATRHLSEMSFVLRALNLLNNGGRLAAILPHSAMTDARGNTATKRAILKHHTLDAVITMNPDTFYGVGVNTCIALFTAGRPHPDSKPVSFIDFRNDGMRVHPHVGLVSDGTYDSHRDHLFAVLSGDEVAPPSYVVKAQTTADEEWLQSFHFFNETPPTDDDLYRAFADYMSFEYALIARGRRDLLVDTQRPTASAVSRPDLSQVQWSPFAITEYFATSKGLERNMRQLVPGVVPLVSARKFDNGLKSFVDVPLPRQAASHFISLNNDGQGGAGLAFYQPFTCAIDTHVTALRAKTPRSANTLIFVSACISAQRTLFGHERSISASRLSALRMMLPTTASGAPDWQLIETYAQAVVGDVHGQFDA